MPNISTSDQQALATEVGSRLNSLTASTPNADLVYLARMIEIFNGNANLSAVAAQGTTSVGLVQAQQTTSTNAVQGTGTTEVAAVQAASATEQATLNALQTSIASALAAYNTSPLKQYFLTQS